MATPPKFRLVIDLEDLRSGAERRSKERSDHAGHAGTIAQAPYGRVA